VRYYCGLFGIVVRDDETPDGTCEECSRDLVRHHRPVPEGACGCFADCLRGGHGHMCALAPGHVGPHQTRECAP